jgi:hypothetical protein
MTIQEAIRKYGIEPVDYGPNKGKVIIRNLPKAAAEKDDLMKQVPEIKKYFKAEKAKEEAERARREANVKAIPGLQEILKLRADLERWHEAFNRSFEGEGACGGLGVGPMPQGDEKALLTKYPQAAAYLKVRAKAEKSNYELAGIGQKALDRFEDDPSKWREIVADMDEEISAEVDRHVWD